MINTGGFVCVTLLRSHFQKFKFINSEKKSIGFNWYENVNILKEKWGGGGSSQIGSLNKHNCASL